MQGDLDADFDELEQAHEHYNKALQIAREMTYRPALIEALLARGQWAARYGPDPTGFENLSGLSDLEEALGYALEGGYRIYEAGARVGLAWAHRGAGDRQGRGPKRSAPGR